MKGDQPERFRRIRRGVLLALALTILATVAWWALGRATAGARRLAVRHENPLVVDSVFTGNPSGTGPDSTIRILTWNIAHGRGDDTTGWIANWTGGTREERTRRLTRMAAVIRSADADVVVLNEVDFHSTWSGGLDQARFLARHAGYGTWVEQRNFDLRLPFFVFEFGNALLSRLPVIDARWVPLPRHSRLEAVLAGAKASSIVRLRTSHGPLNVVPVHLEYRDPATRLAAVPLLDSLRAGEEPPILLAGDFNASPPSWPGSGPPTVVGRLLERGWESPRAAGAPAPRQLTYPTKAPRRGLDWVLAEPPLDPVTARVVHEGAPFSDHAPVLAVIRWPTVTGERPGPGG